MKQRRILSLLPSATEIVAALGAGDELVGRSHECDFPEEVARLPVCTAPRVCTTGTSEEIHRSVAAVLERDISVYRVDRAMVRALRPDVIVTQVQCDVCAVSLRDVEEIIGAWIGAEAPRVVALNPSTLSSVRDDIRLVARAIGRDSCGLLQRMTERIEAIAQRAQASTSKPSVGTIEWISPLMAAGNWVPELIELAGGINLLGVAGRHSAWIDFAVLAAANPDIIVLLPCGFSIERSRADLPFLTRNEGWRFLRAVRNGRVFITDGSSFFNRPGPRLVESLEILAEMLHPELFDFGHRGVDWMQA